MGHDRRSNTINDSGSLGCMSRPKEYLNRDFSLYFKAVFIQEKIKNPHHQNSLFVFK